MASPTPADVWEVIENAIGWMAAADALAFLEDLTSIIGDAANDLRDDLALEQQGR